DGQPMFPCHKDFQGNAKKKQESLKDGAIYVRGASNTRPAGSGEILRLIERGKIPGKLPIDISIDLLGAVHRVSHLSDVMKTLYDQEEQRFVKRIASSRDRPETGPYFATAWKPVTPEQQTQVLARWQKNKKTNIAEGREYFLGITLGGLGLRITSYDRYIDRPH